LQIDLAMEINEESNVVRCEAIAQRNGMGSHKLMKGCDEIFVAVFKEEEVSDGEFLASS